MSCTSPSSASLKNKKPNAAHPSGCAAPSVEKASQSLRPQAQIKFKTFLPAACTSAKILFGSQTCERKRVRCGEPQPLQTRAQRSGSRLRACQKYFFDTLCGASFGMRRSVCRAFSLTAGSFACRIVSKGGILYNAAAKRSPREAGSAPGAARSSRRAVKNNKLTKGRRPYENSVQKAP